MEDSTDMEIITARIKRYSRVIGRMENERVWVVSSQPTENKSSESGQTMNG